MSKKVLARPGEVLAWLAGWLAGIECMLKRVLATLEGLLLMLERGAHEGLLAMLEVVLAMLKGVLALLEWVLVLLKGVLALLEEKWCLPCYKQCLPC